MLRFEMLVQWLIFYRMKKIPSTYVEDMCNFFMCKFFICVYFLYV